MKKLILMFSLLATAFIPSAMAQQFDENGAVKLTGLLRGTVHYVHHEKQQLVIDDRKFIMPLNFKVTDSRGKSSNRFGLKAGQGVEYFVRYDKKTNIFYIDTLQLLN